MNTTRIHPAFAFLLAALAAACTSAPPPGTPGMIYDDEGRPLSGVEISARGQVLTRSDVNGRFLLGPLPPAPAGNAGRVLEFRREGYETGTLDLEASAEALPGSVVYLKMPSRDQLLKQAWAALDRADYTGAAGLIGRARALGRDDAYWALTHAARLLLDPAALPGELQTFLPGLLAGDYGPVEEGWRDWWARRVDGRVPLIQ